MSNSLQKVINNEGISKAQLGRASELSPGTISKVLADISDESITAATKGKVVKGLNKLISGNRFTVENVFGE